MPVMGQVFVWHCRKDHPRGHVRYVARPSPLGNPFRIGPDGTRAQVIEKYREWLEERIAAGDEAILLRLRRFARTIRAGHDLNLTCWCAPLPCHADVVADVVRRMAARPEEP